AAALNGQTWRSWVYVRLIAGTFNVTALQMLMTENNASGTGLGTTSQNILPTSAALKKQLLSATRVNNQAATAFQQVSCRIAYGAPTTIGTVVDFTIRFGLPQLQQIAAGQGFGSPIVTSSAAVTRPTDVLTLSGLSGTRRF